ncbi:hypothetical protein LLE49_07265 [Alicyclobacillus tolerans]|uniref:hypothetical protein n=1 Tax=Alicyclobacillus tolerans TaxID=90970 RepID=UPI001F318EFE|nr:hypothetical protein [Alicyclobacillus tolerans]MCF8564543.1 hypothetical protein [Alicyclobacillus tolerans]
MFETLLTVASLAALPILKTYPLWAKVSLAGKWMSFKAFLILCHTQPALVLGKTLIIGGKTVLVTGKILGIITAGLVALGWAGL